jgi:hypothetical protein
VLGIGDASRLELPVLADVDEDRRVCAPKALGGLFRLDLEWHGPRIIPGA